MTCEVWGGYCVVLCDVLFVILCDVLCLVLLCFCCFLRVVLCDVTGSLLGVLFLLLFCL